jgi:hypothetical protein
MDDLTTTYGLLSQASGAPLARIGRAVEEPLLSLQGRAQRERLVERPATPAARLVRVVGRPTRRARSGLALVLVWCVCSLAIPAGAAGAGQGRVVADRGAIPLLSGPQAPSRPQVTGDLVSCDGLMVDVRGVMEQLALMA